MSLSTIAHGAEIKSCMDDFQQQVQAKATLVGPRKISFRPTTVEAPVYWLGPHGVWAVFSSAGGNRYWNAFGTADPTGHVTLNITCEINFPYEGIDRHIGGAFVKDELGNIFVVHRGVMGGGRRGFNKERFLNEYKGEWVTTTDEGFGDSEVAFIGQLGSPNLALGLAAFIKEVGIIKEAVQTVEGRPPGKGFTPEFEGEKAPYKLAKTVSSKSYHGTVVRHLENELSGFGETTNFGRPDLVLEPFDRRRKSSLFEVKTDSLSTSIYQAIGQLFYYAETLGTNPALFAVFPSDIKPDVVGKLGNIGIETIIYRLDEAAVTFNNLDDYF